MASCRMSILAQVEELLTEPVEKAVARERDTFTALLQPTTGGVVLFGAGRLGRLCARALRRGGVPLRAFCDRNPALWGTVMEGETVIDPGEAAARFGADSLFVVAVWTGTARETMVERLAWLRAQGCRHVTTYAPLVWAHGQAETPFHAFDLPSRVLAQADSIRRLARLLADDASLRVLAAALQQRLWGEFSALRPSPDQYFPSDLVTLDQAEVVVDGGAYDGDTLEAFLERSDGRVLCYHAFEPDPANMVRLRERVDRLPATLKARIHAHPLALHGETADLAFASGGATTSHVGQAGRDLVSARRLDDVIAATERVTFLKLDVEGAEASALRGAGRILTKDRPLTAVCVYHAPTDLWTLPLLVHAAMPEARLHLRQHGFDGWETVCYAVPPERQRS